MRVELLIIDPQNDFCSPSGSLYVPGAEKDMDRLASFIKRKLKVIDDIHVTLDSHRLVDISHPIFWMDSRSNPPPYFTLIFPEDMKSGKWTTRNPVDYPRALAYLEALRASNRYAHCIWPPHCLIGSPGHNVYPSVYDALQEWEQQFAQTDYVTKGSNPYTEHFSGLKAEVPDPSDPSTLLNTDLVRILQEADVVAIAGEASSHCVANTVRDAVASFDPASIAKLVLLTDAMSPVPDPPGTTLFTDITNAFFADMQKAGVRTSTTVDFLR